MIAKKKNFLLEEYKKAFSYLGEIKNFISCIAGIFFLFALIGFFVPPSLELSEFILEYIQEIIEQTYGFFLFDWISFIFINNFLSSLSALVFGVFFGIYPLIATIINGYIVGFVSSMAVSSAGIGSLLNLVPHGIFELPAIFISFACGLKIGSFVFFKKKLETLINFTKNSFRLFILVIFPLLLLAAVIEGLLIHFG